MYTIRFEDEAKQDLRKITDWYETQKPGLGDDFAAKTIETIERYLTKNPEYAKFYKEYRRIAVKRFPHRIVYLVEEQEKIVRIMAIRHEKQGEWGTTNAELKMEHGGGRV